MPHTAMVSQSGLRVPTTRSIGEEPRGAELSVLQGFPYPAAYRTPATCDVVATNTAFAEMFPGLEPGTNLLTWMLLDPMARCVLVEWELEAQLLVQRFRKSAPQAESGRIEEILTLCRRAPDWNRLWGEEIRVPDTAQRLLLVRDAETGHERAMYAHTFGFEAPPRPWLLYTLVPAT